MSVSMSLKQRIVEDIKTAMKSGDRDRLGVLRMLKSRIQEAEVAGRAKQGPQYELSDDEVIQVCTSYAKQRRDSIEAYTQAGRTELAAREQAELRVVQDYLPGQLSEDELRKIVAEAVTKTGASSAREMGAVMKAVMPGVKGRADGKLVNRIVRELLDG